MLMVGGRFLLMSKATPRILAHARMASLRNAATMIIWLASH